MRFGQHLAGWVTPLGRGVAALAAGAFAAGWWLRLPLLVSVAVVLACVIGLAVVLVALPARLTADLRLRPPRATVGRTVAVTLDVRNRGPAPVVQAAVRVPYPGGVHVADLGWLAAKRRTDTSIEVVPTRRGVHQVGPVELLRQDPFGLIRWGRRATAAVELYVRPHQIPVKSLGLGQLSDVDGVASDEVSMSDLAFHALREYVPGDDLRHVHWRSSAKADRLQVRQYHDTRRSRVTLLLDADRGAYATGADFELAVSALASLGVRAVHDDMEVSLWGGSEEVHRGEVDNLLDACCRVERGDFPLATMLGRLLTMIPSPGLLVVITGQKRDVEDLHRDLAVVRAGVRLLVLRHAHGADPALVVRGSASMGSVGDLGQLPPLMDQFLKVLG